MMVLGRNRPVAKRNKVVTLQGIYYIYVYIHNYMYLGLYYTCLCLHICMYLYIYGDDGFGTNKSFRKKKKIHLPFLSGLYCICIYMCLMRIYCESLCIYIHITYTRENSDYIEDDNEDVFMINIYTYVCLYPSI